MERPKFSIHRYDYEGDTWEEGVYLHFGEVSVRVAKTLAEFDEFLSHLTGMKKEMAENYPIK